MPTFNYKVLDKNGGVVIGIVEAPNLELAIEVLSDKGLRVLDFKEVKHTLDLKLKHFSFFNRVSRKELVIFSRQLAVMISATVPIIQAFRVIVKQTKNEYFQRIINQIADDIDEGFKLSEAMRKHSEFGNFFVSMIASGESSGRLDNVLEYLADELEKTYDLYSKIKGAMIYPAFIIGGLIIVGIAMIVFVIPQLTGIISASGQELPFLTKMLISISDLFRYHYIYLISALILIVGGIYYFIKRTRAGDRFFNLLKLKFPIFGKLWQKIYLVRFSSTLASLTSAGVPLTEALKITSDVVDNYYYKKLINESIEKIKDGYSISHVFSRSKIFPQMLSQMMKVGEKTGRLSDVLDKLAGFYSKEVENMVANLTSLLEPLIMVIIGVAVGGMVAAIIMPMYNMANSF